MKVLPYVSNRNRRIHIFSALEMLLTPAVVICDDSVSEKQSATSLTATEHFSLSLDYVASGKCTAARDRNQINVSYRGRNFVLDRIA